MDNLLNNTRLYHDQAERAEDLARKEGDRKRRKVLGAIAEHLYMLHDELVELDNLAHLPAILAQNSIASDSATAPGPKSKTQKA